MSDGIASIVAESALQLGYTPVKKEREEAVKWQRHACSTCHGVRKVSLLQLAATSFFFTDFIAAVHKIGEVPSFLCPFFNEEPGG